MAGDTQITVCGNLVDDPELRFTPSGAAVASFRIASTPRTFDRQTNEFKDGESLFLTCTVWRQQAENCAETLQKGMRVIVQGFLKQRSYETREGEKRTVFEVDAQEVGVALRSASAKVTKNAPSGRQGNGFGAPSAPQGGYSPARPPQQGGFGNTPADDPWATQQPAGQDSPPF